MSAILSADDLNDFISPSVACIKPVETLPSSEQSKNSDNPYEVTTEDAAAAANAPPAQISLTDCLACSGCVTSAEAVLVSLQSYQEVLSTLDAYPELSMTSNTNDLQEKDGKVFVASVSPQARASIAATFGVSERAAGHMIQQLLSGEQGLRSGGQHNSGFAWVLDTNTLREVALVAAAAEAENALTGGEDVGDFTRRDPPAKKPVLTSACPGWICYAEKTHPHVLPHISKLKSPQALAGMMVKTVLAKKLGISPDKIWHMAVMPCFDKQLEASREELTDAHWVDSSTQTGTTTQSTTSVKGIRDVDLVITSRELLSLSEARGIPFADLSRHPLPRFQRPPFPDPVLDKFLVCPRPAHSTPEAGTSGGYLWHILQTSLARHPGSRLSVQRGRNADVVEYLILPEDDGSPLFRGARFYGFRNIQNLVRRLRPARASRLPGVARRVPAAAGQAQQEGYDYVEVMACPGGCSNGGGQVKAGDVADKAAQREWLARVDEAYFSMSEGEEEEETPLAGPEVVDGIDHAAVREVVEHWAQITGLEQEALLRTTYRKVVSDVGKKVSDVERVAGLASSIGGGW